MATLDEHAKAGMAAMADRKWEVAIEQFKAAIAPTLASPHVAHVARQQQRFDRRWPV